MAPGAPVTLSFLSIRRLTSTTLFPYTTLFRSRNLAVAAARRARAIREAAIRTAHLHPNPDVGLEVSGDTPQDRKSTRLNSSHVEISYAVFCLKKKKNCTILRPGGTTGMPMRGL